MKPPSDTKDLPKPKFSDVFNIEDCWRAEFEDGRLAVCNGFWLMEYEAALSLRRPDVKTALMHIDEMLRLSWGRVKARTTAVAWTEVDSFRDPPLCALMTGGGRVLGHVNLQAYAYLRSQWPDCAVLVHGKLAPVAFQNDKLRAVIMPVHVGTVPKGKR